MKHLLLIFLFASFLGTIYGQTPELVVDYNTGTDNSFSDWNYEGIVFNNSIILPLVSNELGNELAIIKNGGLEILKDINDGAADSDPKHYIIYKDLVYFVANDEINGNAIWKTDGTTDGTELFYTYSGQAQGSFIIADNGWMYFNIGSIIYRTDGAIVEETYSGGIFLFSAKLAANNYCKYKDGIALTVKKSDYSFDLVYINGNQGQVIATSTTTDYFAQAALAPLSAGLMLSISGSSDNDGIYVYDENTQSLNQHAVDGEQQEPRRFIDFNESINICWFGKNGYYAVNGNAGEGQFLVENNYYSSIAQGETMRYKKFQDKLLFIPVPSSFEDKPLIITDGTTAGTETIKKLNTSFFSNMAAYGKYIFFADGVSNGFKPNIIMVNMETSTAQDFYTFTESSNNINSIRLLGILDSYLYYLSNLDDQVGTELYRIQTNIVGTNELQKASALSLKQQGNNFVIETDFSGSFDVSVFNSLGQTVLRKKATSNQPFSIELKSGIYFINLSNNTISSSESVFIK